MFKWIFENNLNCFYDEENENDINYQKNVIETINELKKSIENEKLQIEFLKHQIEELQESVEQEKQQTIQIKILINEINELNLIKVHKQQQQHLNIKKLENDKLINIL
jgi:predicted RNase H-like nuclease (RuvC/YqgF family)